MSITVREINDTNCKTYLLESGGKAALVDPVRERLETYKMRLAEHDLELVMILETHMHADHLMMNRAMKELLRAPVLMHTSSPSPLVDRHLRDGEELTLGGETIQVLHTPGHTPDSVSFRFGGHVLTGDVLLIGGSGRTDFPGGDAGAQYDAVVNRIFELPPDTVVLPAHDYKGKTSSTVAIEKSENPRFLGKSRAEYIDLMSKLGLPFPDKIQEALQVNQSGFEAGEVSFPQVTDVAKLEIIDAPALAKWLASPNKPMLLDVREPEEFIGELGHIEGALLVPLDALEKRLPKLHGYVDRDVVMICRAGARSATAGAILQRAGFRRTVNLEGGMLAWVAAKLPVQR
jgi:glyoxylase-like metal-dependent hydrolase (beta-lactamase superfamily II)/rhodanese-related sulfurtransferase